MDFLDPDYLLFRLRQLGATEILLAIMTLLIVLSTLIGWLIGPTNALLLLGGSSFLKVFDGQIWRLLTAAFLHADLLHFAVNMYSLWILGRFAQDFFGDRQLVITFIVSALVGSLASFGMTFLALASGTLTAVPVGVGASGGLFGLMGLLLTNTIVQKRFGTGLPLDQRQLLVIIMINLLIGFSVPGIDNAAHMGGLIAGALLGLVFDPRGSYESPKKEKMTQIGYYLLTGLAVLAGVLQVLAIILGQAI